MTVAKTGSARLKVALVGCGKIADAHADQLTRVPTGHLVAVCDREPLMAQQLAERAGGIAYFSDVEALLHKARPDVVHITTPPQSHYTLGRLCLDHGCHLYIEKPFTETTQEAIELLRLAEQRNLRVTVGNDAQFTHAAREFRQLVATGFLGGQPLHLESYYCYELSGSYAEALMGDRDHWVRRLPGKLLHNIISHGIVRLAEYIQDDAPKVLAHGFPSAIFRRLGDNDIQDELRVIVADRAGPTGYFTFSSQMRPSLHQFRAYGTRNGLVLDDDEHSVIKLRGKRHTSYASKFLPPLGFARQHLGVFSANARLFLKRDFHMKAGMQHLMAEFYRAILTDGPVPIPYREIILTCRIMENAFDQIYGKARTPPLFVATP